MKISIDDCCFVCSYADHLKCSILEFDVCNLKIEARVESIWNGHWEGSIFVDSKPKVVKTFVDRCSAAEWVTSKIMDFFDSNDEVYNLLNAS